MNQRHCGCAAMLKVCDVFCTTTYSCLSLFDQEPCILVTIMDKMSLLKTFRKIEAQLNNGTKIYHRSSKQPSTDSSTSFLPVISFFFRSKGIQKHITVTSRRDTQDCNIEVSKKQLRCVSRKKFRSSVSVKNSSDRDHNSVLIYNAQPVADSAAIFRSFRY